MVAIKATEIMACRNIETIRPDIGIRLIEAMVAGTAQIVRNIIILSIEAVKMFSHRFEILMSVIICILKVCQF